MGPVDPDEEVTVTLLLRRRSGAQLPDLAEARDSRRGPMSREEFAQSFGPILQTWTRYARSPRITISTCGR